jgi:hypothetical protein
MLEARAGRVVGLAEQTRGHRPHKLTATTDACH